MKISIRSHLDEEPLGPIRAFYSERGYGGEVLRGDQIILAHAGEKLIGVVRIVRENGFCVLRGMQILPEYQRQGVGAEMLRFLSTKIGKKSDCYTVPYIHLVSFYAHAGFHEIEAKDAPGFLQERFRDYLGRNIKVTLMKRLADEA